MRSSRDADLEARRSRKEMEFSRQRQPSDSVRFLCQGSRDRGCDVEPTVSCPSVYIAQAMSPCVVWGPSQDFKSPALSVAVRLSRDVKDVSAVDTFGSWLGDATVALGLLAGNGDSPVVRSTLTVRDVNQLGLGYW